ncbi:hypothetical protein CsSME_00040212 [Camellia sinensis var. sinensis]
MVEIFPDQHLTVVSQTLLSFLPKCIKHSSSSVSHRSASHLTLLPLFFLISNGSRVFCKSFLVPLLASTELIRFKFFRARTSSSNPSRVFRMATEPPSSSSSSPPHSASASSNGDSSSVPASSAIDFLSLCHRLKTTKRTGWVRRDVENPESIADHMYRMGLMALK